MEHWLYFLSTGTIPMDANAPGLESAREKLQVMKMTHEERQSYDRHVDDAVIMRDVIFTAREESKLEGRAEGRAEGLEEVRVEGLEEGRKEGRKKGIEEGVNLGVEQVAKNMKASGVSNEDISKFTGLSLSEIETL